MTSDGAIPEGMIEGRQVPEMNVMLLMESLEKLDIQDGDVLIMRLDFSRISTKEIRSMRESLGQALRGIGRDKAVLVILDHDMDLKVLGDEELEKAGLMKIPSEV